MTFAEVTSYVLIGKLEPEIFRLFEEVTSAPPQLEIVFASLQSLQDTVKEVHSRYRKSIPELKYTNVCHSMTQARAPTSTEFVRYGETMFHIRDRTIHAVTPLARKTDPKMVRHVITVDGLEYYRDEAHVVYAVSEFVEDIAYPYDVVVEYREVRKD